MAKILIKNNVCVTLHSNVYGQCRKDFLGTETAKYLVWLKYIDDIISLKVEKSTLT